MNDQKKTKAQLIEDLNELRQRNAELEAAGVEHKLKESEERYRTLYTKTPAMLHSIDKNSRLVDVSDRWLEVLGYERDEVIGRKGPEFLTEESRLYAETVAIPAFFKTGYANNVSYQFVKKNGEIIDILLSGIAEYDAEDHIIRSLAVLDDVTERKQAELLLAAKTNQLSIITHALTTFLESGRWRPPSAILLSSALEQTNNEYGFLGVVMDTAEGQELRILADEGIIWDQHWARAFYNEARYQEDGHLTFTPFDNLFGRVLTSGETIVSKDPQTDPHASGGRPEGILLWANS